MANAQVPRTNKLPMAVSGKKKAKASNAQIGDKPFDDQKLIRCWQTEKEEWNAVAKENNEKTSAWLRRVANEAAAQHRKKNQ